jgi:hypothetical protein
MRRGELSNQVLPRLYIVFEGLVGILPDTKSKALEALHRKRKQWDKAANQYILSEPTKQGMRDVYFRYDFRIDILTFHGADFADAVRDKLNQKNLLFGDVVAYDQQELLHELTYDRSILAVLDPAPERMLTWGGKGRYCTPEQLNLMGLIT